MIDKCKKLADEFYDKSKQYLDNMDTATSADYIQGKADAYMECALALYRSLSKEESK